MSSGQYKPHHGFNPIQIKNGWIVRMRKDGTIKSYIEKYPRVDKKSQKQYNIYMDQYKVKIEADLEIEAFSPEDAVDYVKDIIGSDQEVKSINVKKVVKIN